MSNNNDDNNSTRNRIPLSSMENIMVGGFGGALETSIQMPILTYKFCLQEGRSLPNSVSGWYRGVGVQAGTVAPITAIQFFTNGLLTKLALNFKQKQNNNKEQQVLQLNNYEMIMTAAGAGAISALVYSPVDLITIQQQKLELGMISTMQHLYQQYGLCNGIYRGFISCAGREAIYTAGYLGLAPVITSQLVANNNNGNENSFFQERPLLASISGACIAGTIAAVLTHPIDTIKTCIQSDMKGNKWKSYSYTFQNLYNSGIANLYRGMIPRTIRLCGAFFICLLVQDKAIQYKTKQYYESYDDNNTKEEGTTDKEQQIISATSTKS